ncbi:MAG: hypothetical protein J5506_10440 [Prevotella sp.]|nr:hypothetical protein [Prevotella sp.]
MKKKFYVIPVTETIYLKDCLMDSFPVHYSEENGGEIESKQGSWMEEAEEDDWFQHKNLWEE